MSNLQKNENNEAFSSDVKEQAESVFENIENILNAAGSSMKDVVKAQMFLTDINDFKKISAVRNKWFSEAKPVSTLAEVSGLSRKGAKIEIEVTAIIKK